MYNTYNLCYTMIWISHTYKWMELVKQKRGRKNKNFLLLLTEFFDVFCKSYSKSFWHPCQQTRNINTTQVQEFKLAQALFILILT